MKTAKLASIGLLLMVMAVAWGAETATKTENSATETTQVRQRPARPAAARTGMDREAMYKEMVNRRMEVHQESLGELKAIKKIAEEENAPKTAEAIQKLIDKKDGEFKQELERLTQQRSRAMSRDQARVRREIPRKLDDEDDDKKDQPAATPKTEEVK